MCLPPWQDRARRAAATIAPRQLVKASSYLRGVEANLDKLAERLQLEKLEIASAMRSPPSSSTKCDAFSNMTV